MVNTNIQSSLVSIILPAYNTLEQFLREAIESVLAQTYTNWELLIIDDSTAAPVEDIVKAYSDDRIKYFRNPQNIGMANSRNRGLELAGGEFIAFLDHDDIWLPEKLFCQIKLMQQKNCNMVYSPVVFFGNKDHKSIIQDNVSFADLIMGHNIVSCSCVMIKSTLIREYDLKFAPEAVPADDYAMWINVALYGGNLFCCSQYLVRYRSHGNNVSASNLVCYYPYEWILPDITTKLWKTKRPLTEKIISTFNIYRSRAWVLRKIISEATDLSHKDKIDRCIRAIRIYPIHPTSWKLLLKILFSK